MRRWLAVLVTAAAALFVAPAAARRVHHHRHELRRRQPGRALRRRGNAVDAHDGEIAVFDGDLLPLRHRLRLRLPVAGRRHAVLRVQGLLLDRPGALGRPGLPVRPDHAVLADRVQRQHLRLLPAARGATTPRPAGTCCGSTSMTTASATACSPRPRRPDRSPRAPSPTLAVNNSAPVGGVNNGDQAVFVDDDGTAYLAYTDWRSGGDIVVERLTLDLPHRHRQLRPPAPDLDRGARAVQAQRRLLHHLLRPELRLLRRHRHLVQDRRRRRWAPGRPARSVTTNSCGGQPAFVSAIPTTTGTTYLYASDLWNNGTTNEALANYFWAPLSFNVARRIQPITLPADVLARPGDRLGRQPAAPADIDQSDGVGGFQVLVRRRPQHRAHPDLRRRPHRHAHFGRLHDLPERQPQRRPAKWTSTRPTAPSSRPARRSTARSSRRTRSAGRPATSPSTRTSRSPRAPATASWSSPPTPPAATAWSTTTPRPIRAAARPTAATPASSFSVETNRSLQFATTVSRAFAAVGEHPAGRLEPRAPASTASAPSTAPGMIAYGATGGFVYQSVAAGSVPCTTAAFGDDPDYGTLKSCYLAPTGRPERLHAVRRRERHLRGVAAPHTVAYRAATAHYSYRSAPAAVSCTNAGLRRSALLGGQVLLRLPVAPPAGVWSSGRNSAWAPDSRRYAVRRSPSVRWPRNRGKTRLVPWSARRRYGIFGTATVPVPVVDDLVDPLRVDACGGQLDQHSGQAPQDVRLAVNCTLNTFLPGPSARPGWECRRHRASPHRLDRGSDPGWSPSHCRRWCTRRSRCRGRSRRSRKDRATRQRSGSAGNR